MLRMTDAAAAYAHSLSTLLGCDPVLRVRVIGGGCSGLTWDLAFGAVGTLPGDLTRLTGDVRVVVDRASAAHLRGAIVDFGSVGSSGLRAPLAAPSPDGTGFVLRDLPGKHPCSCGESFEP